MTIQEAIAILISNEGYNWLTNSTQLWFSTREVADALYIKDPATVTSWCEKGLIQNAQNFGGKLGWRMPRNGLLFYFATLQQGGQQVG